MNEEIVKLLASSFLFSGLDENKIFSILNALPHMITDFKRGELIFSPSQFQTQIGFVIDGECDVTHSHTGSNVRIRSLKRGDTFGIISVFSHDAEYPTNIVACRMTRILFLAKEDVIILVERNPQIALNVITFLAERVAFLNSKISTFSAKSVEAKLASHLIALFSQSDQQVPFNKAKAAQAISVGRASLYRAITSLSDAGYITFDHKFVNLIDRKGLERIAK